MRTIKEIISAHASEIIESWAEEAHRAAAARGLERPELTNMMPRYVQSLARGWNGDEVRRERDAIIESHLSSRLRAGFSLDETLEEFAILGRAIVRTWSIASAEQRPSLEETCAPRASKARTGGASA